MKRLNSKTQVIFFSLICTFIVYGFSLYENKKSELNIISTDQKHKNVKFTLSYYSGNGEGVKKYITVEKETPFKLIIDQDYFSGIVQPKSENDKLEVKIELFKGTELISSAIGLFQKTLVESTPNGVGVSVQK